MGNAGSDEAVPILVEVIKKDPSIKVRKDAVTALGHIGTPRAQEALVKILENK